jgi:hypothetical protein
VLHRPPVPRFGGTAEAFGHAGRPARDLTAAKARHPGFRPLETTERANHTNRAGNSMLSSVRNEANSATWPRRDAGQWAVAWAHCAEQSQFVPDGRGDRRVKQSQLDPERGLDGKQQDGQPGARRDKSCETKPICPEVSDRASPVGERIYGYLYIHRAAAKQSQFPAVPGGTGPEGHGTRGKCAKQTQCVRPDRAALPRPLDPQASPMPCRLCETKPIWPGCSWRRSRLQ